MRVVVKVITDYTSIVQFRSPNEVGGIYWTFGFVFTIGSLPLAIMVAESQMKVRGLSIAWNVTRCFIPFSIACFAIFFLTIERKYWHTFLSLQRSKDQKLAYFSEGNTDAVRFEIMSCSKHQWVSIEKDVKKWVEQNWVRWEAEEPAWLTDQKKATVPEDFIPNIRDSRRRESARRASVDTVAERGFGSALRASIRRSSVGTILGGDARVEPTQEE
jgi:hypothetical protein